jgi:diacylglycerol kinase family enzyme
MRALLVVNPAATTTTERGRDVLTRALRSEVDLAVEYTRRRGHAANLARQATRDGVDVVVTLGGDGTVNEVVNGLMFQGPGPSVPALAVVPGGSTNVFARALGLGKEWTEGTAQILEALHAGRVRSVGLGRADERYFTFCAGFGIDAEVVRTVERARLRGKVATPGLYVRSTLSQFFLGSERRIPLLTLEIPGEEADNGLAAVIVQNTVPWTYLLDRPVNACPDASFDTGLDFMALRGLSVAATARTLTHMLRGRTEPLGRHVLGRHDVAEFTLRAAPPLAFQVDGDYLGEREKVTFSAVPGALRVFC